MLQNWDFHLSTRIEFGRGRVRKLGEAAGRLGAAAMLVGYRECDALEETYGRAARALVEAGLRVVEFLEVTPEPHASLAVEGARKATEAGVDVLVALGGGSVIDTAKAIATLVRMGGCPWDYTLANRHRRPADEALPLVAVPTTAGTGAEVTSLAVLTHDGVGTSPGVPLKAVLAGAALLPKAAVVDPDLSQRCPARLTAGCGADTLAHGIEACMSRRSNPIGSALGAEAVGLIVEHLVRAVAEPDDAGPRVPLAAAATLSGAAIETAGVTLTHSIAHALGGLLHIPHGEAVAIATPLNLRYNAPRCVETYCRLADRCGISGGSAQEKADRFVDRIVELLSSVGLPDRVNVPDSVSGAVSNNLAGRLAQAAIDGTPTPLRLNPRKVGRADLERLLLDIL